MRKSCWVILFMFFSPAFAQSEFHHEESRTFYVGENTDENFNYCVEFIDFLPQYSVDTLAALITFEHENPVVVRRHSEEEDGVVLTDGLWIEPTDQVNEEYSVNAYCARINSAIADYPNGIVIYRVVYRYFASELGAFETTNAAGYYISQIAFLEVPFEEIQRSP